jgi:hypothetical protein
VGDALSPEESLSAPSPATRRAFSFCANAVDIRVATAGRSRSTQRACDRAVQSAEGLERDHRPLLASPVSGGVDRGASGLFT